MALKTLNGEIGDLKAKGPKKPSPVVFDSKAILPNDESKELHPDKRSNFKKWLNKAAKTVKRFRSEGHVPNFAEINWPREKQDILFDQAFGRTKIPEMTEFSLGKEMPGRISEGLVQSPYFTQSTGPSLSRIFSLIREQA